MTPRAPYRLPDVTLTDQHGRAFALRSETAGRDVLVFFGYTNCPDECPAQMATLATALRGQSSTVAARTTVVFISSDPHRDTPTRLAVWLPRFGWPVGTEVVGLTGPFTIVAAAGRSLDVPLLAPTVTSGNYEVTHGTQVLGFDGTGTAKALWLNGTSPADVGHDLPLLNRAPTPASPTVDPRAFDAALDVGNDLQLGNGAAITVGDGHQASAVFTVRNTSSRSDTLMSVSSPTTPSVALTDGTQGTVQQAEVPAHDDLRLAPGLLHVDLRGLAKALQPGDSLALVLRFQRAGTVSYTLPVVGAAADAPTS